MENTLVLGNWVIESVRLVNMASTLWQTYLSRLHSRRRNLRVVFLVSDIVDSGCRNWVLSISRLSRRLTIETKQVSQIFTKLTSARDTSIRDGCASTLNRCRRTICSRLLWECLVWKNDTGFNNTFLVELLECSWRVWRRCSWNDRRVNPA